MTRALDRFDLALRQEVRAKLIALELPQSHIDQVVDLGFHAAERACGTLQDIVFSAGDERVSVTAMGVAVSLARERLDMMLEAMIAAANDVGRPVKHFTVGGKNG